MKVVTDIRLRLRTAAAVAFGALALHACQLQAALDAAGNFNAAAAENAEKMARQAGVPVNRPAGAGVAGTGREITVRPQDTLWSIAAAALPPDYANVQQYMLAILRENPHAFANGNINGLIAGSRLRLPRLGAETLPTKAVQEAVKQNSAWRGAGDDELKILVRKDNWTVSDAAVAPAPVAAEPEVPVRTAPLAVADEREAVADESGAAAPAPAADQGIRVRQRDDKIAQLTEDLAALRATLRAERRERERQLARWRMAAAIGVAFALTALLAVVLVMRRRRPAQTFSAERASPRPSPEPSRQDDHHFGAPIGDHRVKLNLAQANIDLGKLEVAREILEEVRAEGGASERREAEALLARIGPAQP